VVAGCGGSDNETASGGFTVPGGVHDFKGELEAVLDQLPYQYWYTSCVVHEVEGALSPAEAEELAELSEAEREQKINQIAAKAGPACEKKTNRPPIDPNASSKELDLLRVGYLTSVASLAEANNLTSAQSACVERNVEKLPDKALIEIGNGTDKVREGILLSVFKPCAKAK
jgi:hypothetical protein